MAERPQDRRDIAEAFGADPERYDRARPRYPRELADAVLSGMPAARVLDVGIGTGISALALREAGATVLGVEVDERMARVARRRGFPVEVSRFEDWAAGGAVFDVVASGQAWHWVDATTGPARAAEVLRPGGRLALFWNVGEPTADIVAEFAAVYRSVDTGLPFTPWSGGSSAVDGYVRSIVEPSASGIRTSGMFDEPELRCFEWSVTVTRDDWLDQVPTTGGHSRIAADRLTELLDGLGRVVDEHGGSFRMNYTTLLLMAQRR